MKAVRLNFNNLGVDVYPKQIPVRGLALDGVPTEPEMIFVRLNQGIPPPQRVSR